MFLLNFSFTLPYTCCSFLFARVFEARLDFGLMGYRASMAWNFSMPSIISYSVSRLYAGKIMLDLGVVSLAATTFLTYYFFYC